MDHGRLVLIEGSSDPYRTDFGGERHVSLKAIEEELLAHGNAHCLATGQYGRCLTLQLGAGAASLKRLILDLSRISCFVLTESLTTAGLINCSVRLNSGTRVQVGFASQGANEAGKW